MFWRYKSRPGRPPIPLELRQLIRRMASENPLWGEERIANELLVKLGLRVSPRTVRKYMPNGPLGYPRGDQRWATFLRNHATAIVACLVTCATCCIAAIPYIGTVILLPVFVLLRSFSLLFLRQFGPEYDVWASFVPPEFLPILSPAPPAPEPPLPLAE